MKYIARDFEKDVKDDFDVNVSPHVDDIKTVLPIYNEDPRMLLGWQIRDRNEV